MASKAPNPQSDPYYWSPEKCREQFESFLAAEPESMQIRIPDWHIELLKAQMRDYCENGVHMIPLEEFEKELIEELKKDYRENGLHGIQLNELDEFEKELLEEITKG